MKAACFRLILGSLAVGALATFAYGQDGDNPPVITDISLEISRNLGEDPLYGPIVGPWAAYVAFDPDTELAREADYVRITVTVTDADLPDDELFARKQSTFWPYPGYLSPEPEVPDGDTVGFVSPRNLQVNGQTATFVFEFMIPLWNGPNQARLRGLINWDVRWFIEIEVANVEEPGDEDPVARGLVILRAVEAGAFRPPNPPPFADAGADQTVPVGSTVELDGSRTFDAFNVGFDPMDPEVYEKDTLTYTWEWITGPERVDPIYRDVTRPYMAEVTLNTVGEYTYRLLVSDGSGAVPSTDSTVITVVSLVAENNAPRAVIVPPADTILEGSVILLDGTSSFDPDGDPLSYRWTQTDELGGAIPPEDFRELFQPLSGLTSPISTWQAVRAGTYYFRLLVDDGDLGNSATVSLEVIEPESAGIVVGPDGLTGSEQEPQPAGSDDLLAPLLPGPAACGGSLVPLALLPLLLWPMRGRIR